MAGRADGGDGVQYCDMMSSLARNNNISMHDIREFKSNILKVSLPFPWQHYAALAMCVGLFAFLRSGLITHFCSKIFCFISFFRGAYCVFCSLFCLKKLHLKTNHTFLTQWPINKFTHTKIFSQYLSYYFTWWSKRVCLEK